MKINFCNRYIIFIRLNGNNESILNNINRNYFIFIYKNFLKFISFAIIFMKECFEIKYFEK